MSPDNSHNSDFSPPRSRVQIHAAANSAHDPAVYQRIIDVIASADHSRQHHEIVPQNQFTTIQSPANHEIPIATGSDQQSTEFAPDNLESSSTSPTTSFQPMAEIPAASASSRLIRTKESDVTDMQTSIQDAEVELPVSDVNISNIRQTAEMDNEEIRLYPEGQPCIQDRKIKNDLIVVITKHVEDPNPKIVPQSRAMFIAEEMLEIYKHNAQPPADWKDTHPQDEELYALYTVVDNIMQESSKSRVETRRKCIKILRTVNKWFGSLGWGVPLDLSTKRNDSAIADMSRSSQLQSYHSVSDIAATHLQKHLREATVPRAPGPKRPRLDPSESQVSVQSRMSSPDLSQDPPDLPRPENQKTSCREEGCSTDLRDLWGWLKHLIENHFPEKIYVCRICGEEKLREDRFFGTNGHFHRVHQIVYDKSKKRELRRSIKCVEALDAFPDICHYCLRPLTTWGKWHKHMKEHCRKKDSVSSCSCHCKTSPHDWRESRGMAEYRKEIAEKKKQRQSCQDPDLPNSDGQESDDEDEDDDRPGPSNPGSGSYRAGQCPTPSGSGSGNEGKGASRFSTVYTSPSSNDAGPNRSQPSSELAIVTSNTAKSSGQSTLSLDRHPHGFDLLATDSGIEVVKSCFRSIRKLGRGTFGNVDEVVWKSTNKTYARKIIHLTSRVTAVSAEVEIMKQLRHKHIVNLAAHWETSNQLWLFMTPVAINDLAAYLHDGAACGMKWPDREMFWKWESCLASALQYLHAMELIHGDIKPSNILVSSDLNIYLADFGSARAKHLEKNQGAGTKLGLAQTPKYCAPEISYHKSIDLSWEVRRATDIFSLGCVWAEIETVCTSLSIQAFETFRSAGSADSSFQANLPRTYRWIDFLWVLQQPFLSTPRRCAHAPTKLHIKDMLNFDPLRRPTVDYLTTIFRCSCKDESSIPSLSSPASSQHASTLSSKASRFHNLDTLLPGERISMTLQWKVDTGGFWPKYQVGTSYCGPRYTYTLRWDLPLWQTARATSAAPYFFSNKVDEDQPFFRSSKTYLLNGYYADFDEIKVREDDARNFEQEHETFIVTTRHHDSFKPIRYNQFVPLRLSRKCSMPKLIGFHQSYPSAPLNGLHSLPDYVREVSPPSSVEDTLKLWGSMLALADALAALHERRYEYDQILHGWHQDVKPENILVLSSGTTSPYEWRFGLADPGFAHFPAKALAPEEGANVSTLEAPRPSPANSRRLSPDGTHHGLLNAHETNVFDTAAQETCSRSQRVEIWSLGCLLAEVVAWVIGGSEGIKQFASHHSKLPPKSQRPISKCESDAKKAKCKFSEVEEKARKTREDLLESLVEMPESVTKSIAESVITPMLEPPEENYSWKKIRDKARTVLSDCWSDYKTAVARAATPLLSLVRPKNTDSFLSSTRAIDGEVSVNTKSIASPVDNDPDAPRTVKDELREDTDIDPNISEGSSLYSYSLERYLRDKSDYMTLLYMGSSSTDRDASKELHKVYLGSVMDSLKRFDDE